MFKIILATLLTTTSLAIASDESMPMGDDVDSSMQDKTDMGMDKDMMGGASDMMKEDMDRGNMMDNGSDMGMDKGMMDSGSDMGMDKGMMDSGSDMMKEDMDRGMKADEPKVESDMAGGAVDSMGGDGDMIDSAPGASMSGDNTAGMPAGVDSDTY